MKQKSFAVLLAALLAVILTPSVARADTYLTPFVGVTFGADAPDPKVAFGGAATFMARGWGLDLDLGYSPDFDGHDSKVVTASASYIAGGDQRGRGTKGYGLVGLSLLRTSISGIIDDSSNDVALHVGGGIVSFFNATVGLRGEIRYYRQLAKPSDTPLIPVADRFDFWRALIGVSFRVAR